MATVWGRHVFALGPMLAFLVIGGFVLLLKWAFPGRNTSLLANRTRPGDADTDYGLLTPVGQPTSAVEAAMWQEALRSAGIRATIAQTTSGARLMVRREDEQRASDALRRQRPPV